MSLPIHVPPPPSSLTLTSHPTFAAFSTPLRAQSRLPPHAITFTVHITFTVTGSWRAESLAFCTLWIIESPTARRPLCLVHLKPASTAVKLPSPSFHTHTHPPYKTSSALLNLFSPSTIYSPSSSLHIMASPQQAPRPASSMASTSEPNRNKKYDPKKPHITDEPITRANWYKHVNWLNVFLIVGIPIYGLIAAYWTPLQLKTAVWAVAYYFMTGLGITAGRSIEHQFYTPVLTSQRLP